MESEFRLWVRGSLSINQIGRISALSTKSSSLLSQGINTISQELMMSASLNLCSIGNILMVDQDSGMYRPSIEPAAVESLNEIWFRLRVPAVKILIGDGVWVKSWANFVIEWYVAELFHWERLKVEENCEACGNGCADFAMGRFEKMKTGSIIWVIPSKFAATARAFWLYSRIHISCQIRKDTELSFSNSLFLILVLNNLQAPHLLLK